MRIEILTIGGEILSGRIADSNFLYLTRTLSRLGVTPVWHTTVPDQRDLLAEALRGAIQRADGVIVTGGLGGTPDDLTRRVLAQVLGRNLVLREDLLREIEDRYQRQGRTTPASAQALALVPQGAELIPNPVGLAPALLLPTPRGWLCAFPGVPAEMRTQVEQFLLPFLERRLGSARGWEVVLRTAGVSETVLAEAIGGDHPEGLEVAYLPGWGGVDLRLIRGPDSTVDREEFHRWTKGIQHALGSAVYGTGEETLEQIVGRELAERGLRLALAESLSGGAVGAALTRVPGSSRYFLGSVVAYDNGIKQLHLGVRPELLETQGAVSASVAEAMAAGVRRLFRADLALSTTGIAGPDGATAEKPIGLVYLGLSTSQGERSVRRLYPGNREGVMARVVAGALLLLHRHLLGLPLEVDQRKIPTP